MDMWCGIVVTGEDIEEWGGKEALWREKCEKENGVKLMKDPVWLIGREKGKMIRLKWVGMMCHVAKCSDRDRFLDGRIEWNCYDPCRLG